MNPFVDPKKRSISLPSGCKDLVDVLTRSEAKHNHAIRRFIHMVLLQAQQDRATELVIGVASASEGTRIQYKVQDTWYDISPFPADIRPAVVAELVRMAKFHAGQIPGEGVLDEDLGDVRLRWVVAIPSAVGECVLTRVQDL